MEGDVMVISCPRFSGIGLIFSSLHYDQCALVFFKCGHFKERYKCCRLRVGETKGAGVIGKGVLCRNSGQGEKR
jgi:hypothetical protein